MRPRRAWSSLSVMRRVRYVAPNAVTCLSLTFATASVFASQDPVAIDSVAVDFSAAEATAKLMVGDVDNYLHEAALADRHPALTGLLPSSVIATDDEYLADGVSLGEGARFHLIPPVSGG